MHRSSLSVWRISFFTAAGLAPFYIAATVFIDPTLRVLAFSGVLAVLAAAVLLLWRMRQRLVSWYCRLPLAVRGALAGCFVWCVCFSVVFVFRSNPIRLPDPFEFILDMAVSVCGLLAWPVALGGWVFWWGDNTPPHPIVQSIVFNIACGIGLNATVGAVLFCTIGRSKTIRSWLE